jgi:hypothetical protein
MTHPASKWSGSVQRGWCERGKLPDDILRQLPDAVQQEFAQADDTDGSGETYLLALHKEMGHETHTSKGIVTLDVAWGDYSYSRWTQTTGETFEFVASVLAGIQNPQTEWLYVRFVNRTLLDTIYPEFTTVVDSVNSAIAGLEAFSKLVGRSTHGDSSFHWVLLTLRREVVAEPGATPDPAGL